MADTVGARNNPDEALDVAQFELAVRRYVYDEILLQEVIPTAAQIAYGLSRSLDEIISSFSRLKEAHILVLQDGDREILMANPFSAVPTTFVVELGTRHWWGNCIWDALGIAAMVKGNGRISAVCGDCHDPMTISIDEGKARFADGTGIIHFAVPANRWWVDIRYT